MRHTYDKGVFVRFGFDAIRTSQTLRIVKNKATGTPHEVYCIHTSPSSNVIFVGREEIFYTYTGVGLSGVARFDNPGNAKAFMT